ADIVRRKVKPERDSLGSNPVNLPLKRRWWAYQAHRPDFYRSLSGAQRVLVTLNVSQHLFFTFLPTGWIYSIQLVLFRLDSFAAFALLQSRIHELWVRAYGSAFGGAIRYSASDCFQTFPFP